MEKKIYLLVYSDSVGNRDDVIAILNVVPQIINWRYDMPNCFYIISTYNANELVDELYRRLSSEQKRFFITEISNNNYEGYLPKETWDFIKSVR